MQKDRFPGLLRHWFDCMNALFEQCLYFSYFFFSPGAIFNSLYCAMQLISDLTCIRINSLQG
jgi:hypothetical protein